MRNILSLSVFVVLFAICTDSVAQSQQGGESKQSTIESAKVASTSKAIVDPLSPVKVEGSANEIQIIEGRKVNTDNKGIQSLAVPAAIESKKNSNGRKE